VHVWLIAAPQHCADHAATEAAQIRGLFGACSTQRAGDAAFSSLFLRSCFFPLSIFGAVQFTVAVKKNSPSNFFFSKEGKK
jgi:hypothetical protein